MQLTCEGFGQDERIPAPFTCDGAGQSPALHWGSAPSGTQSFALIVDDPDAPSGDFTHWVLYNLSAKTHDLPADAPHDEMFAGGLQGRNSFGQIGYGAPCPPAGKPHHYRFTLYALDTLLAPPYDASKDQVAQAMQGHVLDQTQLVGVYKRQFGGAAKHA